MEGEKENIKLLQKGKKEINISKLREFLAYLLP